MINTWKINCKAIARKLHIRPTKENLAEIKKNFEWKSFYPYCVWFPEFPEKTKFFTNKVNALMFMEKQKVEVYLNNNVGADNEDTLLGMNTPTI